MNDYLQISGLTKHYGPVCALEGIDLAVSRGKALALLGPNGAGKSTLFGCLLGLTMPTRGEILLERHRLTREDRARVGYCPERVSLYPHRTVAENGVFFACLRGQTAEAMEKALSRVGLGRHQQRKTAELSKGMLQRLGLAIALCGQPDLLVLDEPFNGLDPSLLETLQSVLLEERDRGTTLLISTHTISAVEPLATDVAILLDGRLVTLATMTDLRANYGPHNSLEHIYQKIAREREIREEVFA